MFDIYNIRMNGTVDRGSRARNKGKLLLEPESTVARN